MLKLFTIGYEKRSLDEFVATLLDNQVKLLVDVRHSPRSRRPGFSKLKLAGALSLAGIHYAHIPELGIETALRDRVGETLTRDELFEIYENRILKNAQPEVLRLIGLLEKNQRVAITCFERDPLDCHRSHLAAEMRRHAPHAFQTVHL